MSKSLMAFSALLACAMAQAASNEIGAAKLLYSNTGTDLGVGTISQDFLDGHASAAADDFVVPEGLMWTIHAVDVTGAYYNGSGPAESVSVTIYKASSHGKVGKAVAGYTGPAGSDANGSFSIPIPKTKLGPGAYFVSVVANMHFTSGGQWRWENMLEVHGHPPEWESPGSGGRCQTWRLETKCFGPGTGDHFFRLWGRAAPRMDTLRSAGDV